MMKVLMDGGNSFNMLYVDTFNRLRISGSALSPSVMPLRRIALPVTFNDQSNFRTEKLTFDVVGFARSYKAILGRPC